MIELLRIIVSQLENREEPMTKAQMSKALGKSRSYIYNLVEKGASYEVLNQAVSGLIDYACYHEDKVKILLEISKQLSDVKISLNICNSELHHKKDIIRTYEKNLKQQKRQYDQSVESYNISVQQRKGLEEENANLHVELKELKENKEILKNCINKKEDALLKEIEKSKELKRSLEKELNKLKHTHQYLEKEYDILCNSSDKLTNELKQSKDYIKELKLKNDSLDKSLNAMSEAGFSVGKELNNMRHSRNLWFIVSLLCVIASLFGFFYHAV